MTDKNALAMFGGAGSVTIGNAAAMAESLKGAAQADGRSQLPDGGVYISFSGKMDRYSIGVDKENADPEEVWLVNIYDFQRGYICWKGGQPVARHLASIYGKPVEAPDTNQHGPFNEKNGEGWFSAKSITMRSIDRGIQGLFQTNTKSALSEFAALEDKVADRLSEGLAAWPIIQLHSEKFKAQGQTNGKPVLTVYGWVGMKQVQEMAAMESVDEVSDALDQLIEDAKTDHEPDSAGAELPDNDMADDVDDNDGIEEAETVDEAAEETEKPKRRRAAGAGGSETKTPPRRRAAV